MKRFLSQHTNLINLLRIMPKIQTDHVEKMQKQRKKIKEKTINFSPSTVTLQVLGTGARGAPTCLYIFSDQSRYLFNCGEGTQRLAHEHKMKLAKLEHVFITHSTWKNLGGLPGTALTIQDVGVPEITLHGPEGLDDIFHATRRFIIMKNLTIKTANCDEDTVFEDNVMKVNYIKINRKNNKIMENVQQKNEDEIIPEDDTDYYAYERSGKRVIPLKSRENLRNPLKLNEKSVSIAFICKLQPRPGALSLEKCVKFGVPPGPLLGKLKSGQNVILSNGNEVKATDVCEPDDPGPTFIVLECPSEDYLDSLLENEKFCKYQENPDNRVSVIVHFTPQNILENPKYQEWINRFPQNTNHLIINETNHCMGSLSVHRIQYKLNLLSNQLFPLLNDDGVDYVNLSTKKFKSDQSEIEKYDSNYIYPKTLYRYYMRPKRGTERDYEIKLNPTEYIDETLNIEGFPKILDELKRGLNYTESNYPKILFLGTGSSIPNKTRNTSGILLQLNENMNILMDCGEGTFGQMYRFFGSTQIDQILINTKAIYISHLHADHHLGFIGFLQARKQAFENLKIDEIPILLLAPKQISSWLNFYDAYFECILNDFKLIPNSELLQGNQILSPDHMTELLNELQMSRIETCYVRHCPNAFGVNFKDINNYSITYSGDTMPSDDLIQLGLNSDLLIHEATMEDELCEEALIKMHSTTSQAIEIGKKMNAKFTLLTHFSQRYAKLPRFNDNFSNSVGIAFDNMQIKIGDLNLLPKLQAALKIMFAEHYDELEHKAVKRQLKLERQKK